MADSREVIWLLKAEVDFQETYNRIERYSEERAEKFYHSVNAALDLVASVAQAKIASYLVSTKVFYRYG